MTAIELKNINSNLKYWSIPTSYTPSVKCRFSITVNCLFFWSLFCYVFKRGPPLCILPDGLGIFDECLLHEANLTSECYWLSGMPGRQASPIQSNKFSKRPWIVHYEVICLNHPDRALFVESVLCGPHFKKSLRRKPAFEFLWACLYLSIPQIETVRVKHLFLFHQRPGNDQELCRELHP